MQHRGYSLVELMVAVATIATLLGLAAPAMRRQRAEAALRTAAGQTLSALHLARRLALASGQVITVCPAADGVQCSLAGDRWMLFANRETGSQARREADEQVLRTWHLPEAVKVGGTRGYAAFQPRPGSAATVTFEFTHAAAEHASRSVIVSQTGRPRLALP